MKTQGHVGTQGGLRGHSVGGTYPWMPVGYGDDTWVPTNLVTGEYEARRYKSVAECLEACQDIKEGLEAGRRYPVDTPCIPPSMELTPDQELARKVASLKPGCV